MHVVISGFYAQVFMTISFPCFGFNVDLFNEGSAQPANLCPGLSAHYTSHTLGIVHWSSQQGKSVGDFSSQQPALCLLVLWKLVYWEEVTVWFLQVLWPKFMALSAISSYCLWRRVISTCDLAANLLENPRPQQNSLRKRWPQKLPYVFLLCYVFHVAYWFHIQNIKQDTT